MQRHYVTKQSNQCPSLFRIPAPKSAPGIICPHSTENCACREQKDAELKHAIKPEMHWRVRPRGCGITRVSPQQDVPETHCQREGRIAQSDREHMNGEPEIIAQHGDERIDA